MTTETDAERGRRARIGRRVVELRKQRGWEQVNLAVAADIGVDTISRIERGIKVSEGSLAKVAAALQTSVDTLANPAGVGSPCPLAESEIAELDAGNAWLFELVRRMAAAMPRVSGYRIGCRSTPRTSSAPKHWRSRPC
ncbi:MAG: helix-turn-helix transcriptional regulator [Deltaproteobacteria bacterium]|nr:helix-turn-helix transcriptional regulator [Deltaproteobacteria bacterium]